jgi:hypothetical protein
MRRWVLAYSLSSAALIGFVCVALWAFNDFKGLDISWHGMAALIAGCVLVSGLSIGLMAAVFWSHRGGHDESAHDLNTGRKPPDED